MLLHQCAYNVLLLINYPLFGCCITMHKCPALCCIYLTYAKLREAQTAAQIHEVCYIMLFASENQTLNSMQILTRCSKIKQGCKVLPAKKKWKISCKNITALCRYHHFRVGVFYFGPPCI